MTMSNTRRKYSSEFKAKVALSAVHNEQTIAELARQYGVHPTMINNWKRTLLNGAADIFARAKNFVSKIKPKPMNCFDKSVS